MQDPERIDGVLEAVRRAWRGQPELSLATLFAMLANEGLGWGTDDERLVRRLNELADARPAELPDGFGRVAMIDCEQPAARVTIDGRAKAVTVVPAADPARATAWRYGRLGTVAVGWPVAVYDEEGIRHRLGVCRAIAVAARLPRASLGGLTPEKLGEERYLVDVEDGTDGAPAAPEGAHDESPGPGVGRRLLVARRMTVVDAHRRETARRRITWQRIEALEAGGPVLVVDGGGRRRYLGVARAVHPVDLPEAG